MKRIVLTTLAAGAAAWALMVAAAPESRAAPKPTVTSVIEGHDAKVELVTLTVVGRAISQIKRYEVFAKNGVSLGDAEILSRASTTALIRLPQGVVYGEWKLKIHYGANGVDEFPFFVENGQVPIDSLTRESFSPTTLSDLDDAQTLDGAPASTFAVASKVLPLSGGFINGTLGVNGYVSVSNSGGNAVIAYTSSSTGRAVYGSASNASGSNYGVYGESFSPAGAGVSGFGYATTGAAYGVQGTSYSGTGVGVVGYSVASSGATIGVFGQAQSLTGTGVFGWATNSSGAGVGVSGRADSSSGQAVLGDATSASGAPIGVTGRSAGATGTGVFGIATSTSGATYGAIGETDSSTGIGVRGTAVATTGSAWGVWGDSTSPNGEGVRATSSGTGSSSAALVAEHVGTAGDIAVFIASGSNVARIDRAGKGFFDGGTQTGGADFAESVAVNRPKADFEPGDVLVIDPSGVRRFALSRETESTLVAGVYATKPGVLARPAPVAASSDWEATEAPMAITGIVPCKVCDEGGAIRAGDLLVASSVPGRAKKAGPAPRPGTLIGKALAPLEGARGKIEILLSMR